ncbi:extracellular triacylglycerol lipase precursor [Flagelloscypha sp. PMI_526]|nr:extracellular triacylglycerol lipase precursor [Flagelloscypha sp. PMI_526]
MKLPVLLFPSLSLLASAIPEVKVGNTKVFGAVSQSSSNVEVFRGIPYAEPPVGQLRFERPVLRTSLNGSTFNASSFGAPCLQKVNEFSLLFENTPSEDCLNLNIYRPSSGNDTTTKKKALPVFFWIHGGAFTEGSGLTYDGSSIVNRSIANGTPIIFVSINYRLAEVGFPSGTEVAKAGDLNLGLRDQLAALEWVSKNIEAFGGDKTKVTVGGQSSGAVSIDIHIRGNTLKEFARGVIMESGGLPNVLTPQQSQPLWSQFVSLIPECASVANSSNTLDCLKNTATAESIQNALSESTFGLVLDGEQGIIPDYLSRSKPRSPLTTLIGSNLDEGTLISPQNIASEEEIKQLIRLPPGFSPEGDATMNDTVNQIVSMYPDDPAQGSPFGTGNQTFGLAKEYKKAAAIQGDFIFHSNRRGFSEKMTAAGNKVFAYHFTDNSVDVGSFFPPGSLAPHSLGVSHLTELLFLGFFSSFFPLTDPTSFALANLIQDYWVSFVTSLDPNSDAGEARPKWPLYTVNGTNNLLSLNGNDTTAVTDDYRKVMISFINHNNLVFSR